MARFLAARRVRPNRISQAGVVFAAIGALAFAGSAHLGPAWQPVLLALAATAIQCRLFCNLLDGMVAVEGGLGEADGSFWNEAPDRVSDMVLLVGAGCAAGDITLGWIATALAIFVSYLRELGRAEGLAPDYSGPMAKQHRMAILTIGCLVGAFTPSPAMILSVALWVIVIGAAATALLRSMRLVRSLKAR